MPRRLETQVWGRGTGKQAQPGAAGPKPCVHFLSVWLQRGVACFPLSGHFGHTGGDMWSVCVGSPQPSGPRAGETGRRPFSPLEFTKSCSWDAGSPAALLLGQYEAERVEETLAGLGTEAAFRRSPSCSWPQPRTVIRSPLSREGSCLCPDGKP